MLLLGCFCDQRKDKNFNSGQGDPSSQDPCFSRVVSGNGGVYKDAISPPPVRAGRAGDTGELARSQ